VQLSPSIGLPVQRRRRHSHGKRQARQRGATKHAAAKCAVLAAQLRAREAATHPGPIEDLAVDPIPNIEQSLGDTDDPGKSEERYKRIGGIIAHGFARMDPSVEFEQRSQIRLGPQQSFANEDQVVIALARLR
jgi:hypothetical protein